MHCIDTDCILNRCYMKSKLVSFKSMPNVLVEISKQFTENCDIYENCILLSYFLTWNPHPAPT